MIRQHFLQQQRLNYNHDRLLERYNRLLTPQISQFRTFGTSSLPGRNYNKHLSTISSDHRRGDSLVTLSRAGIGLSSETYRWMGDGTSETLPKNVSSVMQHTRQQSIPLVHAEKFEPVQVYEHPIFGPTPAYIRPIYNERQHLEKINDNNSDKDDNDNEEDNEVRSHTSADISVKSDHQEETKTSSTSVKNNNDDDDEDHAPKGYISYKKWKAKYGHLIPVNPLLFNIYTQRPNGSINSYGQSLYASPNHSHRHRQLSRDEDIFTPPLSEIDSVSSEVPRETSLPSNRRYYRLRPQILPTTVTPRSLEPIHTENENDLSDDEPSPPDSPVPYLSRNKPNPITPTSLATTIPSTSIVSPPVPTTVTPTTINTSTIPTTGITSTPVSTIVTPTTINIPTVNTTATRLPPLTSTNTSNIPPAPPMPPSLLTTSSTASYQTPSSLPISSPPIAPPMPASLSTSTSTTNNQPSSNISLSAPSAPSLSGSTTKAVTFGGLSSIPVANDDVSSSSSDSDDDEKKKRRRRKKRQAAAAAGIDVDSSSSDD